MFTYSHLLQLDWILFICLPSFPSFFPSFISNFSLPRCSWTQLIRFYLHTDTLFMLKLPVTPIYLIQCYYSVLIIQELVVIFPWKIFFLDSLTPPWPGILINMLVTRNFPGFFFFLFLSVRMPWSWPFALHHFSDPNS